MVKDKDRSTKKKEKILDHIIEPMELAKSFSTPRKFYKRGINMGNSSFIGSNTSRIQKFKTPKSRYSDEFQDLLNSSSVLTLKK